MVKSSSVSDTSQ